MKLDIYIEQSKYKTTIIVEIDGKQISSMRKIVSIVPNDITKSIINIIISITLKYAVKFINVYCARKGLYLYLTKKEKDADLIYLNYLLQIFESTIQYKKFSEINFKFDAYLIYFGTTDNESIILQETTGHSTLYDIVPVYPIDISNELWSAQLLHMFITNEINTLKGLKTGIYFLVDNYYIVDRLNQLLMSQVQSILCSIPYIDQYNTNADLTYILLKCALLLKELNANIIFLPRYQNKACRYKENDTI